VTDPERYGVVEFDASGLAVSIEEKPKAAGIAIRREPASISTTSRCWTSPRNSSPHRAGELEITDVNPSLPGTESLKVEIMGRGMAWLDTGTHESLLEACSSSASSRHARAQGRLSGGNRLANELDRFRTLDRLARPWRRTLRPVPAGTAKDRVLT